MIIMSRQVQKAVGLQSFQYWLAPASSAMGSRTPHAYASAASFSTTGQLISHDGATCALTTTYVCYPTYANNVPWPAPGRCAPRPARSPRG